MKYIVLKDFYDRFDNKRLCKAGEEHTPPNKERAKQLIEQGFIKVVESKKRTNKEADDE